MKKIYFALSLICLGCIVSSCNKDEDKNNDTEVSSQNLDYTSSNATAWGNYASNVALLLQQDATTLYNKWNGSYAAAFKAHNGTSTDYTSAESCIEQIIDGCIDIANEVGEAKIGEPYKLFKAGKTEDALYSVESWYSWHSRDDYKNNILSVANSLLGQPIEGSPASYDYSSKLQDGTLTKNSIIINCMTNNTLRQKSITAWKNVGAAWSAIDAIPQPFRNNIGSPEVETAMAACATLVESLKSLKEAISTVDGIDWQPTVDQFVDVVALPTYKELASKNTTLYNTVLAFQKSPSDANFKAACQAWLDARQPWETSEAFLFGPVSELGLDPNMDSWPLDTDAIANLLKSQNWSEMNWSGTYEEVDEDNPSDHAQAIEAAQSVRGFHTLEFLLFKNGNPRTIK